MTSTTPPERPPQRRRWLFTGVLALGLWLGVELAAFLLLSLADGHLAWPSRLRAERAAVLARSRASDAPAHEADPSGAASEPLSANPETEVPASDAPIPASATPVPADVQRWVPHPFLGYVEDPSVPHALALTAEGFPSIGGQRRQLPPDAFVVMIFGGSVAQHLCHSGAAVLRQELARLPQAAGRRVWIQCYALGGYKQPQQLIALNYALARGERPGLVLNLDGFNDVALGAAENVPNGVNPFFPRSWQVTAAGMSDPVVLRRAGEAAYLETRRARRAALADSPPWRYSAVAHVLWRALDRAAEQRIASLAAEAATPARASFLRNGPSYEPRPLPDTLRELAAFWARSSRLMDGVCRSQGIPYFHFLQPNQYVEGSKPMGEAERQVAFGRHAAYARTARRGYPELIAEGKRLQAEGERFFDLTQIFAQVEEPLYVDNCCHLNPDGMRRLAQEIAARILGGSE